MLRSTALIDAPPRTVTGLLRDVELTADAWRRLGHRCRARERLLAPGTGIALDVRVAPGLRVPVRMRVEAVSADRIELVRAAGPVPALRQTVTCAPTLAGTLVMDEWSWTGPFGPFGRALDVALVRRLVLRAQAARLALLAERAAAVSAARVVVAGAVVRAGRLLVAQRTRPAELAGRWELPGGRVEPGESEPDAVRRELREELGTSVLVGDRVGTDLPIASGMLRVYRAELGADAPEPRPLEHAALRWIGPDELAATDWVAADRAVLPELAELLADAPSHAPGLPAG